MINSQIDTKLKIARAWHLHGNVERAIVGYREIINRYPDCTQVYQILGDLLIKEQRGAEALDIYRQGLLLYPNNAEFHKQLISLLIVTAGLAAAFKYYDLRPVDQARLVIAPDAILCCIVVRNEMLRLPDLLAYYRNLGVDRFLVVDNGSTDDTQIYLATQSDVSVWQSDRSFSQANFGADWFELLLQQYGVDHWCLTIDADEFFYYHNCETRSIRQLCADLDREYKRAFTAILLDMYSDRSIQATHYQSGQDLLQVCPYFDRQVYHHQVANAEPFGNQTRYVGGMRERVFGKEGDYYLNKVPLIKYQPNMILSGGQHHLGTSADQIAAETGVLLHFKYINTFPDSVASEVKRQEHDQGAYQYQQYATKLNQTASLTLYDPAVSLRLQNSQQLVTLGIIQAAKPPVPWIRDLAKPLKILLYTDCFGIYGATQWNNMVLMALQDRGYCVACAQYQYDDPLFQERQQAGITHHWLQISEFVTINSTNRTLVDNWAEPYQLFTKVRPDLILFANGGPLSNLVAIEVARDLKIPFISVIHAVMEDLAIQYHRYLDRFATASTNAKAVITVSQENLDLLHHHFRLPSEIGQVIYNGRPDRYFQPTNLDRRQQLRQEWNIPDDGIVCLTAARIDPCKGYQYQVMAMQQLRAEKIFERLYFVWAGSGSQDLRLKKILQAEGLSDQVRFLGERSDIPDLLDAADIFILPSQFEGMPLSIMEAMAKGVPVIATAVSGIPEELGNTGALLPDPKIDSSATVSALAGTLKAWASQPEQLPELGQAGKERAIELFRADRMLSQYLLLIEQALMLNPN